MFCGRRGLQAWGREGSFAHLRLCGTPRFSCTKLKRRRRDGVPGRHPESGVSPESIELRLLSWVKVSAVIGGPQLESGSSVGNRSKVLSLKSKVWARRAES